MKDNALYLEVDEDITSAIDKLSKAPAGPVQIVVPKRSTMLQSIINLKLLKKAADQSGKELVLVTGDNIASELAARVGLAVAPAIGAKAVMSQPSMPEQLKNNEEIIDANEVEAGPDASTAAVSAAKPAAKKLPTLRRMPVSDGPPPPLSDLDPDVPVAAATAAAAAKRPVKVPNFNRMQRRIMWGALGVFLIAGYFAFMYLFTTAKVTLYASGTKVGIDTSFSVDTESKTSDKEDAVIAGQTITVTKDLSGSFVPSGKKDVGTKAGGTMTVKNEYDSNPHTLQSGTRFMAPDGKIFRSTAEVVVPGATPTLINGKLGLSPGTATVNVTADQSGDSYNEAPARYTIPGLSPAQQAQIYGQGEQMAGGTSKTVSIVTKADVDTAKGALLDKDKDNVARDLEGKLPTGYMAIDSSRATSAVATPSPAIDAEGETGSIILKVTYTVLAVKKSDYTDVLLAQEQKQVGESNQIYEDGLSTAQVTSSGKDSVGRPSFHLTTDAYSGTKIDKTALAEKIKGERYGDANTAAAGLPGVTRAEISIWPSWVSKLPSRADKISVTIQVASNR